MGILANHNEIVGAFSARGWYVIVMEEDNLPSVMQMCDSISHANLIVGPHGAGFANLICASEGATVIEILAVPKNVCFESLACSLNLRYHSIQSNMSHTTPGSSAKINV